MAAAEENPADALAMLERMAEASSKVSYSGTFVFHHGGQAETSRTKTVLIDPRGSRQFPVRLEQVREMIQHYRVVKGSLDRVAGAECQWLALMPRDALRYERRFCAEVNTGLPLRSRTLNEKNETLEAFAFSTLQIGGTFRRELVQSRYAAISTRQNWRVRIASSAV